MRSVIFSFSRLLQSMLRQLPGRSLSKVFISSSLGNSQLYNFNVFRSFYKDFLLAPSAKLRSWVAIHSLLEHSGSTRPARHSWRFVEKRFNSLRTFRATRTPLLLLYGKYSWANHSSAILGEWIPQHAVASNATVALFNVWSIHCVFSF